MLFHFFFIYGEVLEKSARPGIEPGTLGILGQRSTDWAIEAGPRQVNILFMHIYQAHKGFDRKFHVLIKNECI